MSAQVFRRRIFGGLAGICVLLFGMGFAGASDTAILIVGTVAGSSMTAAVLWAGR